MSDSSCALQRARSSIFIVSESLFPLRSHGNVLPQSPSLRVIVESTSWVGRFGRVNSYFDRGKQFEISSHNRVLFHCFLILDDARYYDTTDRYTETHRDTIQHQTLQESISPREGERGGGGERGRPNSLSLSLSLALARSLSLSQTSRFIHIQGAHLPLLVL
jgi:hypothetical protein